MRSFKLTTVAIVSLLVLTHEFWVLSAVPSDQFGNMVGPTLVSVLIGLTPSVIYFAWVRNEKAILVCGIVLLVTTVPAWIYPMISGSDFASFYAYFLVFPFTLLVTIMGARIKPQQDQFA